MQKVMVQMEVPKECKEVVDLIAAILTDIKMKKSLAEVASGNLPKLFVAVEGFDQLGAEFMSDGQDEVAGYLVQQMMAAFKAAPVVAPAPAPVA